MAGIVFSQKVVTWGMTIHAVTVNIVDLGHTEADRAELAVIREEVNTLGNEQIALQAKLQQVTRDLEDRYRRGGRHSLPDPGRRPGQVRVQEREAHGVSASALPSPCAERRYRREEGSESPRS